MFNGILNLSKKKKKSSRRDFFRAAGTFFCAISVPTFSNAKKINSIQENEFVMVDGWVLKKKDIHDLQSK